MMFKRIAIALVVGAVVVSATGARADEEGDQLAALVTRHADSICTVRTILKISMKGQSQSQDSPITLQGVVVHPSGLVMVSNLIFSPMRAMEIMGSGTREGMPEFKYTPTNIKVVFAGDDKEYGGFLAATDTNLDLAFIQIEGLGDKKFPAIDFSSATQGASGQKVAQVCRLQKGYDYAPFFQTGRITGQITKPRRAYMTEGGVGNLGLPVFALSGESLGVLSTVAGGGADEASASGASFGMFMRMMTGGGGGSTFTFVLPSSTVKGVVDQAVKRAAEVGAEREAKRKAGKPVDEPPAAKPGTKPPATKPAAPGKKPG